LNIILYVFLSFSFFAIAIIIFNYIISNKFNLFVTIMCSILIISLILNPENCINSSLFGARLFVYKVFPTMFPFVILTNIIVDYGGVYIYAKIFGKLLCKVLRLPPTCSIVIIISALCGYPLGGKYCADLYENRQIDFNTAERLLNIASNCSPLFIVGTIGSSMLNSSSYAYLLLISNYFSCVIMSFLIPLKKVQINEESIIAPPVLNNNLGESIKKSVENSISSCTLVGGFIIMFSVILNQINSTSLFHIINQNKIIGSIILGIIEMTNGCSIVHLSQIDILLKLMLFSFFTSFGGLCVMSQVYAFTYKHKFNMLIYMFRKVAQGVVCAIITFILYAFYSHFNVSTISTEPYTKFNINFTPTFIILIFILPFIVYKIIKLIESF
jgi:sporulation integral membrane protein YlbJ